MELTTFLITVFCLIDDWLAGQSRPLRQRGPNPILADSEVLTIECVGEFLDIDTDKGLYDYFRRSWGDWFPGLRRIHRTTFTRQAANLWAVKAQLRQQLLGRVAIYDTLTAAAVTAGGWCGGAAALRCTAQRVQLLAAEGHLRVVGPGC